MKLFVCLAAVAVSIAIPSMAQADGVPTAGCSSSKDLLSIDATILRVDLSIYDVETKVLIIESITALDDNGNDDGFLCSKQFKPNRGQGQLGGVDYVITQIQDNQPAGRL